MKIENKDGNFRLSNKDMIEDSITIGDLKVVKKIYENGDVKYISKIAEKINC